MSQYFPKPFNSHFGDSIRLKLIYLIMQLQFFVPTSIFALETNLSSLKTEVDKLDILVPIPVD